MIQAVPAPGIAAAALTVSGRWDYSREPVWRPNITLAQEKTIGV